MTGAQAGASGAGQVGPSSRGQSGPPRQGPPQSGPGSQSPWAAPGQPPQQPQQRPTDRSASSAWQTSPQQSAPPRQQSGPLSEGSYLWGSANQPPQQPVSPWSNALPPQQQQQRGPRHAAAPGGGPNQLGPMGQPVQQSPNWQYPPIPIPQPPGGARRRKPRKTPLGLLIGLVVLAVLIVGTGITLLVRNTGKDTPTANTTPTTQPSETPSSSPSESPSSAPTPSTPRGPTVDEVVKASRLYSIGPVAASKCVEPPYAPVNVPAAQVYYNHLLPCLNHSWWLALKKVNLPYRNPKALVYVGKLATPCGVQRSVRASYCGVNETIYVPFAIDNAYYRSNPVYARALMLNTFAHEYGHHVQKLTGILAASLSRQQNLAPNLKLQESRRRELQATCLGAVYLGANAAFTPMRGPLLDSWKFLIAHTGDDYSRPRIHDHGNRVSNYQWSITGFNSKKPNSCNTFTAADIRVN
ncbi:neutral zinc metallopeptidase [Kribbella sp. NPDC026611]|uniref:neutral zinc metallopeptidase n=1 Tax=Kribbella sp. NPDC026611 TaxID=3154911 RepID=UPI0034020363